MYIDDAYTIQTAYQADGILFLVDIGHTPQDAIQSIHLLSGNAFHIESAYVAAEILNGRGQTVTLGTSEEQS